MVLRQLSFKFVKIRHLWIEAYYYAFEDCVVRLAEASLS